MIEGAKIFGVGLSKTGTTSLYAALLSLGYRAGTYRHLKDLGLPGWFRGEFHRNDLVGFEALTDLPIGTYFSELDRVYPGFRPDGDESTYRRLRSWLKQATRS